MKLKLYPVGKRDREIFWIGVVNAVFLVSLIIIDAHIFLLVLFGGITALNLMLPYLWPDETFVAKSDEYSSMIDSLGDMSTHLAQLGKFLERERKRVADTEITLKKMREEKATLQPVIETQRETVDAILAVYASRARSAVWKDRMVGFSLGVLSSITAAMIFEHLLR